MTAIQSAWAWLEQELDDYNRSILVESRLAQW